MPLQTNEYYKILESEMLLALGCTEPIAIALCAAKARALLGSAPDKAEVFCSANVIKNTHSVTIPNSGRHKGIPFGAALGICGGDPALDLNVLERVKPADIDAAQKMIDEKRVTVKLAENVDNLYIHCLLHQGPESAEAIISGKHTHFSLLKKNDEVLHMDEAGDKNSSDQEIKRLKKLLTVKEIYDFAKAFDCAENKAICELLERQIVNNYAIAQEGLSGNWGQQVGKVILNHAVNGTVDELSAYAAAGSDARMSGCAMPVVINSGSGNQGMTLSVPLIHLAKQLDAPKEKLMQALILANLIAIHEKKYIGSLSAYCGAVSAGAAAAAGMAYLRDYSWEQIQQAIINTLAVSSGIICDGAKPSCAAKIAMSIKNAQLGVDMAAGDLVFQPGDGILGDTLEQSIRNVGRLAKDGMASTDLEILDIMLDN